MPKTFSAVTYNVLAQRYINRDRYRRSSPEALDAETRRALLLRRLDELATDLLCLQEAEVELVDVLVARFGATHHHAFAPRAGRGEGSAIFARRDRFAWHGHDVLHFASHRDGDDDLALIAHVSVDGRALRVASTHLTWQPDGTPAEAHVGRRQMLELLAHRDSAPAGTTWLFAGDFNANAQSVVLEAAYQAGMAESCREQRPWDTTAINGRPRKIDYLLCSDGRLTPRPGVLPRLTRDAVLPSSTEPSDHLSLRVDFALA